MEKHGGAIGFDMFVQADANRAGENRGERGLTDLKRLVGLEAPSYARGRPLA
jgi:hypothetical protein